MTLWHAARRLASSAAMRPLKVGFVGAGAVGTYFGVRLAELGHDVRFLNRRTPPASLKAVSWQGDFVLDNPRVAATSAELVDAGERLDWRAAARIIFLDASADVDARPRRPPRTSAGSSSASRPPRSRATASACCGSCSGPASRTRRACSCS